MSARELTAEVLRDWGLPALPAVPDKDSRGRVLVAGGGVQVAGAVLLAAVAALRAGAGKVQIGAPASVAAQLAVAMPEARVMGLLETVDGDLAPKAADVLAEFAGRCDAIVIGPGLLDEDAAGELTLRLLSRDGPPMVVDAAAMPALAEAGTVVGAGRLVLTPHAGEMAGLSGRSKEEVLADPLGVAREMASQLQAVIAMKGPDTFIVSPDGHAWKNVGDCPGLATSGSGDVLAGVIGGLLARGLSPLRAAAWASYLHGEAGRRLAQRVAPIGFLARELLDEIAPALHELSA